MKDMFLVSDLIMAKVSKLPRSMILVYLKMCHKRGSKETIEHDIIMDYDVIEFTFKDMKCHGLDHEGSYHIALRELAKIGVIKKVGHKPAKYRVI